MAWTPSAPQRGTFAAVTALVDGQRRKLSNLAATPATDAQKADASRGQTIAIAAWLGVMGAAAPSISPLATAALLCASGAALLIFSAPATQRNSTRGSDRDDAIPDHRAATTRAQRSRIDDLLTEPGPDRTTLADRAAFAKLTAHMSHELRTPLNAILGFSEIMSNEVFGPLGSSSYAGYAKDIHKSGLSLLKSADDALAITALLTAPDTRRRTAKITATSAANEAIAFHTTALAAKRISVTCTIDGDTEIYCDAQTARQLMINILDDAIEKAEHGTVIAVASRTVGHQFEILTTTAAQTERASSGDESFSILLARTLSELGGAELTHDSRGRDYHVSARFTRANQHELF